MGADMFAERLLVDGKTVYKLAEETGDESIVNLFRQKYNMLNLGFPNIDDNGEWTENYDLDPLFFSLP